MFDNFILIDGTEHTVLWYQGNHTSPFLVFASDQSGPFMSSQAMGWHHHVNNNVFYLG